MAMGEDLGSFSGTPQYAAPEQHLGTDNDSRSGVSVDVYALGAILFEVLSGRRLFEFAPGTSLAEIRRAVLEKRKPRLSEVMSECPQLLDDIVARALRRDPSARFYTAASMGRALFRMAELSKPAPTPNPSSKPQTAPTLPATAC